MHDLVYSMAAQDALTWVRKWWRCVAAGLHLFRQRGAYTTACPRSRSRNEMWEGDEAKRKVLECASSLRRAGL